MNMPTERWNMSTRIAMTMRTTTILMTRCRRAAAATSTGTSRCSTRSRTSRTRTLTEVLKRSQRGMTGDRRRTERAGAGLPGPDSR